MDTRINNTALSSFLVGVQKNTNQSQNAPSQQKQNDQSPRDQISSRILKSQEPQSNDQGVNIARTRLIQETTDTLDNGYRRTQTFENADGRQFTRTEEFISQDNRARRTIVQQNASGSTTLLEDVYDRREDGSFRLTQRFTNEIGETSVNIDPNAQPADPNIILGRTPRTDAAPVNQTLRGGEIDIIT